MRGCSHALMFRLPYLFGLQSAPTAVQRLGGQAVYATSSSRSLGVAGHASDADGDPVLAGAIAPGYPALGAQSPRDTHPAFHGILRTGTGMRLPCTLPFPKRPLPPAPQHQVVPLCFSAQLV